RVAVHAAARARSARPGHRHLLRRAADHGRRADDQRGPARRIARPPRHALELAPAGQPQLVAWPAAEDAVQAVEDLCLGHSRLGHRLHHRLRRRHHGHWRRLPAGADAHLFPARADGDRHRHLDGADVDHHGFGHGAARRDQPPGRRHPRRAVRRPYRAEDAPRAAAADARPARLRRRRAFRLRAGGDAGRSLFVAAGAPMIARAALVLAVTFAAAAAKAERLVVSLSNERVAVTSNFVGENLVLFGTVQAGPGKELADSYDLVVTVAGPRETLRTRRKQRVLGIFVNVDSREFVRVPSYLAIIGNRPFGQIAGPEILRRQQVGMDNFILTQRVGADFADTVSDDPFRKAFVRLKQQHNLYIQSAAAVTFLTPSVF